MKLYATSTLLLPILSLLSTSPLSVNAANRHAGTRRQLDLSSHGQVARGLPPHHANVKRVPIVAGPVEVGPKMRHVRRHPNAFVKRAPAAYGAVPVMGAGTAPIVGLVGKRDIIANYAHNGHQGTAVDSTSNTSSSDSGSSSTSNGTSTSSSSDSTDDDEEECEAEDDEDDDEEDGDAEDEEDCNEEDETSETSSSSSASASATATVSDTVGSDSTINVQVNAKQNGKASSSSSSSSSATPSASANSSSSKSSSGSAQTNTGIATWFRQNGVAGNCGNVNQESAKVIALYSGVYDNGGNCGRTVQIQNLDDGTSTTATVADSCPSCGGPQDIDLSIGAFEAIDPEYQTHGVRNIKWWYID